MERRIFSYEEALDIFPQVQRITELAVRRLEQLAGPEAALDPAPLLDRADHRRIVSEWVEAMVLLGIEVKGLWLIDFDSGSGYYCWRYPESTLCHFHGYEEGYSSRVQLN
jgi:hypothetical protein